MEERKCLRCGGTMEAGRLRVGFGKWVVDWAAGARPPKGWLSMFKEKPRPFVVFRCTQCGAMEMVAGDRDSA